MAIRRFLMLWLVSLFCITTDALSLSQENLSAIAKKVEPSVILVLAYDQEGTPINHGRGFFISKEGDVITDRDVLEGADHADVRTGDGMLYPVGKVLAEDRETDLIRISVEIPSNRVHPLSVTASLPQVGEKVFAIGPSSGPGKPVSFGIVSVIREIPAFGKIIQVTAHLTLRTNGSPVVNVKGEVIGVAAFHILEGRNLNSVLPSERIVGLAPGKGKTLLEWEAERKEVSEKSYSKGLPFLWKEDYGKALPYFEEAVRKNPRFAKGYFQIGYCNAELGRYKEAVNAYRQSINVRPDFAIAHFFLGLAYLELGDRGSASNEYKILKDLDQNYANDLSNMIH